MSDALSGVLFPTMVLVIWVALGVTAVIYLGRHGHRSPYWYVVGIVLGPMLLPIALELAPQGGALLVRAAAAEGARPCLSVLAAVDGSQESDDALDDAARVLAPEGAQFVLLTVLDPDLGEDLPAARERAERMLAARATRLPASCLPAVHEVVSGDPAQVILERADADTVDLIVLGRRGRGLSELVFGSVADRVVRRSRRPVLLGAAPRP